MQVRAAFLAHLPVFIQERSTIAANGGSEILIVKFMRCRRINPRVSPKRQPQADSTIPVSK